MNSMDEEGAIMLFGILIVSNFRAAKPKKINKTGRYAC